MSVSQCVSEIVFGFIAPSVGITIASIGQCDIKISPRAITNIMYKFVGPSLVVFKVVFAILCLREGKIAFFGRFVLDCFVDEIFGE